MNKNLILYNDQWPVPLAKPNKPKRNVFKAILNFFWLPIKWTVFGLKAEFYFKALFKCTAITGLITYFIYQKYGITHWDMVYLVMLNNLIYPYAKFLFPAKGRFRRFKEEGIMVTMTREEYDRSVLINIVVPYFFAIVLAPIGLVTLFFTHLAANR